MVQWETLSFGYGQVDRSSNKDAFSQELETTQIYHTTSRVRNEFSKSEGADNIPENLDEIRRHEKYGCNDLSLDEADGDFSTGHNHEKAIDTIKAFDSDIADVFSDREIEERLQKISSDFPDDSFEEIISRAAKDLSADASHMRNH